MGMSWIELLKELLNDFYKLEMWVWEKFIKPSLIMMENLEKSLQRLQEKLWA